METEKGACNRAARKRSGSLRHGCKSEMAHGGVSWCGVVTVVVRGGVTGGWGSDLLCCFV